jgi:hypothetical protein
MFEAGSMGVLSGLGPEQVTQTEMGATQLAFFEAPLKETGMLFNREVCYYPMQNLQDGGPWTFLVPGEKVKEANSLIKCPAPTTITRDIFTALGSVRRRRLISNLWEILHQKTRFSITTVGRAGGGG